VANHMPIYIGDNAVARLADFCGQRGLRDFVLVVDRNTYAALGRSAESVLRDRGCDVLTVCLEGDDVIADARYVMQVLWALDRTPRTYIAVGSGTITDIARFVSHRTRADFISLPTAPSVDGFTSIGAPMVVEGQKLTIPCQGPLAVFSDLPTLCAAPRPLIAAGFGDMLAKLTSVADWELGHTLWDEEYDSQIAERMRVAAWSCAQQADAIAAGTEAGVRALMDGLIESGLCMLDFGQTLPASGFEHHISHYLEMKLLWEGRHSILHGIKVGLGVLISARRYDAIRRMPRDEARARLQALPSPDRQAEARGIRAVFGPIAEQVIAIQQPWFEMTASAFDEMKARIVEQWDEVQRVAATVPVAADLAGWIGRAGSPITPAAAGLGDEEVRIATRWAYNLKYRMTIGRLGQMLGIP
jgi:glycerol-1-phosphate dehydrogenase [NAD(P)+]